MPIRRSGTPRNGVRNRCRLAGAGVLGVLAAAALVLSACSSSNTATSTTTTAATGSASLKSLQKWPTSSVSLQETGSTLLYPLFNLWVAQIEHSWPNVSITTGATGSGTGVSDAANGTVEIGASDAYLSPAQVEANPDLENIPLAVSAQMVNYNLPGVGHLKLDGQVLAAIYQGQITKWNDSKIAALNSGVALPDMTIIPVHRSDSSGDTFLFSSFLSASDPSGWTLAPGTTVSWPAVTGALAAQGNGGMVTTCKANPGCVAYIGISYQNQATAAGLGYGSLKNKSGNYELPTQSTIAAAASEFASKTPASGTQSMIYGSAPSGYPIVNYEYGIVSTKQSSSTVAQTVKSVLAWAVDPTNGNAPKYLDQVGFVILPVQAQLISANLIAKVS
jgi:phosphate transport system substrate-binding protein